MMILVVGGSKAGKSRWAEKAAVRLGGRLEYVATMIPVGEGEAGAATVQRHRAQRAGLGFTTHERPLHLGGLTLPQGATVLLEDVSNLLANYLFCEGANGGIAEAERDVALLAAGAGALLAVSFEGLEPSPEYNEETNRYIAQLGELNAALRRRANAVVHLQNGVPTLQQGTLPFPVEL